LRDDCLVAVMNGLREVGFGAGEVVAEHDARLAARAAEASVEGFPPFWLRDNCPCAECVHPQTHERLLDTFALDPDVRPEDITATPSGLSIRWSDGHHSAYATEWLHAHARDDLPAPRHWGAELTTDLPEFAYADVMTDDGALLRFTETVWALGLAFVRDVPTTEVALRALAERVGHIRATNFGPDFHVEAIADPNNVAYTPVELRPHTDLPYHQNPPGVQFLHCLAADAPGGDSVLVDGFWVADRIRDDDPQAFRVLCEVPIPYRFRDEHHDLRFASPVIGRRPDGTYAEIRFHNALMAPLDLPAGMVDSTYAALRRFDRVARSDEARITVRLQPGDAMVFHNRRVLHGRKAFDPGGGRRRLFGLYVDVDEWQSRIRVLRTR
jgi:gamma-butyrobetaine dioxygenase